MRLAVVVVAVIMLWAVIALLGWKIRERFVLRRWSRQVRKGGVETKALPVDRERSEWDAQFRRTWWGQR